MMAVAHDAYYSCDLMKIAGVEILEAGDLYLQAL